MEKNQKYHKITPEGSLGILAYGDVAFKKWREVKRAEKGEEFYEEE